MEKGFFKNIGKTLKVLSKVLFWTTLFMSAVLLFYGFFLIAKHDYYTFSEVRDITKTQYLIDLALGIKAKTEPYEGLQFMRIAPFLALLSIAALPLYALGSIVETLKTQLEIQRQIAESTSRPSEYKLKE